jgi:outer membrane cobalamin receptor
MTVLGQARADGSANTVKVDAFTVASARVAYLWKVAGRSAELSAGCENLLDEAYEFRAGYPMPGRSFQFGLKAGF